VTHVSRNLSIFSSFVYLFFISSLLECRFLKYSHIIFLISLVSVILSLFSPLILLIQVISFLLLVNLVKGLSIFCIISKKQLFVSLICCIIILLSNSLVSALIFIIYDFLAGLTLVFLRVWGASTDFLSEFSVTLWCGCSWLQMSPLKTSLLCPIGSGKLNPQFHVNVEVSSFLQWPIGRSIGVLFNFHEF
jgi:hypothetical protein